MSQSGGGLFGRPIDPATAGSVQGIPKQTSKPASQGAAPAAEQGAVAAFDPREPTAKLEDVVLSTAVQAEVHTMLSRMQHHRVLYEEWDLKSIDRGGQKLVVNLYGPPGTGKTMLAEALANRLSRKIIDVSYAEIESKYVGDTPKNIVAAFKAARESDSVIFFDEADSILGKRLTSVTQASDHGVNVSRAVMLKELDRFSGIVLFATNLARNFDGAFVRRILFHLHVPAPDREGRLRLWRKLIPKAMPGSVELDYEKLADATDGMVGGDIKNAVVQAAAVAVQRESSERRVRNEDLLEASDRVKRAKLEVGDSGEARSRGSLAILSRPATTIEQVETLPHDMQAPATT